MWLDLRMNWVGVKQDELFSIQKTKNKQMSGRKETISTEKRWRTKNWKNK